MVFSSNPLLAAPPASPFRFSIFSVRIIFFPVKFFCFTPNLKTLDRRTEEARGDDLIIPAKGFYFVGPAGRPQEWQKKFEKIPLRIRTCVVCEPTEVQLDELTVQTVIWPKRWFRCRDGFVKLRSHIILICKSFFYTLKPLCTYNST